MKELNKTTCPTTNRPERVIQFGEGNFLRGFVDWIFSGMNRETDFNGNVVVVQPIEHGMIDLLQQQDGLYHVNLQGVQNDEAVDSLELIDVISRCINPYTDFDAYLKLAEGADIRFVVSNTTEAGIVFDPTDRLDDRPAKSYPAKLTQLLYRRYTTFSGDPSKGLIILPCELIFHNGTMLRSSISQYIDLWQLEPQFREWFESSCVVCNTLVDRIVSGYPADTIADIERRTGYKDSMVVKGELFHLWVIEGDEFLKDEFPAARAGLNVFIVPDETPYHDRKVTLLNAPHTVISPIGLLMGIETVGELMQNKSTNILLRQILFDELLPTLDLPFGELLPFANAVLSRFANPFVKHHLSSIMLNAFPKYRARVLPALKRYTALNPPLPMGLVTGLAALVVYYKGVKINGRDLPINDDPAIVEFVSSCWRNSQSMKELSYSILSSQQLWGEDLNLIYNLTDALAGTIDSIYTTLFNGSDKNQ